ncbi:dihydrolipoamide acetyltransferase family protein [Acidovorax sp. JHL-9]|uniref:dihydrolipoamide acetyltransferase family protein n=1 Tax=Acidovorax sp. JHL-9 TaxID=1276756 RepID=UPI00047966CC|nr:dihydrolipoamide acetyltransferase family protein [Acidovorax sp. JHL-9]
MRQELLMPKLGLTMTEGTVVEWVVSPGAAFRQGDILVLIETDKVVMEYPAEADGMLLEASVKAGEVVTVGAVIGYVYAAGGSATSAQALGVAVAASAHSPASAMPATVSAATAVAAAPVASTERVIATPLARRIATRLNVDLHGVAGTGPRGRIRADDVHAAAQQQDVAEKSDKSMVAVAGERDVLSPTQRMSADAPAALRKPTSVEATMARRLTAAKQQIPHFYLASEAEVSRLMQARSEINDSQPLVKLTLSHLVVAAVARAMRKMPTANQVWTDEGIQSFDQVDVGVAVNTARGLLVPVVRDIGWASLSEIARRVNDVVERARTGAITSADMGGGAITVSNAGMHEVTWMTPIINPGTAMILGVGSIRDVFRPDAQGQPSPRHEMGLVLAADHRLVDGVSGLAFLNCVIGYLRQPLSLL